MIYINTPYKSRLYKVGIEFCPLLDGYVGNSYPSGYAEDRSDITNGNQGIASLKEQTLKPRNFELSYPLLSDFQFKSEALLINDAITGEAAELFKNQALVPDSMNIDEVLGGYEITVNKNYVLSILLNIYTYFSGAAHGYTAYSSLTFDTRTGNIYAFSDLFNGSINYVYYINQLVYQFIKENNIPLFSKYNGITPDQKFYLTTDSLVLYYQIYEYTPYAYGLFRIPIPYIKIQNLLSSTSPIKKLL